MEKTNSEINVKFREPYVKDGSSIWYLVKETGVLDLNSAYSYLMLCRYFSDTCVVAESGGRIVGFVSAFKPPQKPDVIFVWQVAVSGSQRGKGLGSALLKELLKGRGSSGVKYLETTISPSNKASQALFEKLAGYYDAPCEVSECFPADVFPGEEGEHESEMLYRIGPVDLSR